MPNHLIVWDVETVPDLRGFAAANGHDGKADHEIREAMGDKFPKHIYHSIICIGALVAHCDNGHWQVDALGAPHIGERPEKELITGFVNRIAELSPQLVTFNGSGFDLPVLRYRAMIHALPAIGLAAHPYFHRYRQYAIEACRENRMASAERMSSDTTGKDGFERLPNIAKATCSTRLGSGSATNCFVGGCLIKSFE